MFTIGGGYAMIPLIQAEIVDKKGWMEEEEFIDTLAIAQSAPGAIAVNTAIFVGHKIFGRLGVLITTLGSVLPSFIIILLIAIFFKGVKDEPTFKAIFMGIRPAVVALILSPVITMSKKQKVNIKTIWIIVAVGILIAYKSISPILFILLGLIGGNVYYGYIEKKIDEKTGAKRGE